MSDDKIKVLFISSNNAGVKFYRFYQFAKRMDELGLAHCRIFPDFEPKRVNSDEWELQLKDNIDFMDELVNWSDIIVCQYIHSPIGFSVIQAMKDKKPLFMEVDDYLHQVPYYSPAYDTNPVGGGPEVWATRQAMESNGIITTTEYLKTYWSKWNRNVHVIPNCINYDEYDKYKSHSNGKIRLGWIGGANHEGDLRIIKNVITDILKENENIEFYLVSFPTPNWEKRERLNLIQNWVPINEYPKYLKELSFDIALAPLRDNEFNRGKSNLRYLEYSACKFPSIASNVEPFKNDFQGILANDEMDWYSSIMMLAQNEKERLRIGWNGYYDTKEKFNLNSISKNYYNVLKEAI